MVLQGVVLSTGAATYQILEDRSSSSIKSTLAILHPVPEDFGSYEVTLSLLKLEVTNMKHPCFGLRS